MLQSTNVQFSPKMQRRVISDDPRSNAISMQPLKAQGEHAGASRCSRSPSANDGRMSGTHLHAAESNVSANCSSGNNSIKSTTEVGRVSASRLTISITFVICLLTFVGCVTPMAVISEQRLTRIAQNAAEAALALSEVKVNYLIESAVSLSSSIRYTFKARQNAPIPSQDVNRIPEELIEEMKCNVSKLHALPMTWWQKWVASAMYEVSFKDLVAINFGFEDGSIVEGLQVDPFGHVTTLARFEILQRSLWREGSAPESWLPLSLFDDDDNNNDQREKGNHTLGASTSLATAALNASTTSQKNEDSSLLSTSTAVITATWKNKFERMSNLLGSDTFADLLGKSSGSSPSYATKPGQRVPASDTPNIALISTHSQSDLRFSGPSSGPDEEIVEKHRRPRTMYELGGPHPALVTSYTDLTGCVRLEHSRHLNLSSPNDLHPSQRGVVYEALTHDAHQTSFSTGLRSFEPREDEIYKLIKQRWMNFIESSKHSWSPSFFSPLAVSGPAIPAQRVYSPFYFRPITLSRLSPTPVVIIAFPIVNLTNDFVGVGEVQLRLDSLKLSGFKGFVVEGTEVFIVDRHSTVVTTSITNWPTFSETPVNSSFFADPLMVEDGRCTVIMRWGRRAASNSQPLAPQFRGLFYKQRYLRCMHNVSTFGHKGLQDAFLSLPSITDKAVQRTFGGKKVIAGSRVVKVGDHLRWRMIAMIPRSEIVGSVTESLLFALMMSVCVFVVLSVVACCLVNVLLSPLAELAELMRSGQYLLAHDEEASPSVSSHCDGERGTAMPSTCLAFGAQQDLEEGRSELPTSRDLLLKLKGISKRKLNRNHSGDLRVNARCSSSDSEAFLDLKAGTHSGDAQSQVFRTKSEGCGEGDNFANTFGNEMNVLFNEESCVEPKSIRVGSRATKISSRAALEVIRENEGRPEVSPNTLSGEPLEFEVEEGNARKEKLREISPFNNDYSDANDSDTKNSNHHSDPNLPHTCDAPHIAIKAREKSVDSHVAKARRKISFLSDVAAIQNAYWAMAAELRLLRGYIPLHVCEQLLASSRTSKRITVRGNEESLMRNAEANPKQKADVMSLDTQRINERISEEACTLWRTKDMSAEEEGKEKVDLRSVPVTTGTSAKKCELGSNGVERFGPDELVELKRVSLPSPLAFNGSETAKLLKDAKSALTQEFALARERRSCDGFNNEKQNEESNESSFKEREARPVDSDSSEKEVCCDEAEHFELNMDLAENEKGTSDEYNQAAQVSSSKLPHREHGQMVGSPGDQRLFLSNNINMNSAPLGNYLTGRYMSTALVNLVGFHSYTATTPAACIVEDHSALVQFIHESAHRCGGVLDTFCGDKFWVSFNATSRCEEPTIAATLFACDVVGNINYNASMILNRQQGTPTNNNSDKPIPSANSVSNSSSEPKAGGEDASLNLRLRGANGGATSSVTCGKAFVGTLGTNHIRRHTIIGNLITKAAALERLAGRYPDCGVIVGGDDMIGAIRGRFKYLLLDAVPLPDVKSHAQATAAASSQCCAYHKIASIKGPMCCDDNNVSPNSTQRSPVPKRSPFPADLLPVALRFSDPLPTTNPYEEANKVMDAAINYFFLGGQEKELRRKNAARQHEEAKAARASKRRASATSQNERLGASLMPDDKRRVTEYPPLGPTNQRAAPLSAATAPLLPPPPPPHAQTSALDSLIHHYAQLQRQVIQSASPHPSVCSTQKEESQEEGLPSLLYYGPELSNAQYVLSYVATLTSIMSAKSKRNETFKNKKSNGRRGKERERE